MKLLLSITFTLIVGIQTTFLVGCSCSGPPNCEGSIVDDPDPIEAVLCLGFDLSGKFKQTVLNDDGKAFEFAMGTTRDFMQARSGSNDRIILFQISGNMKKQIMWEGTPREFKDLYGEERDLKRFLMESAKSPNDVAPVYRGISDAIEYMLRFHESPDKTQTALLVFSSFIDTDPDSEKQLDRMKAALRKYSKTGHYIHWSWIDHEVAPKIEEILRENGYPRAGFQEFINMPTRIKWR